MKVKRAINYKKTFLNSRVVVILIFFISIALIFSILLIRGDNKNLAKATIQKDLITKNWNIYETNYKINKKYLDNFRFEYDNLTVINAEKTNLINSYGGDLKIQLSKIQKDKAGILLNQDQSINSFNQELLDNISLQEIAIKNAIETSLYFTCMVEKKSSFNKSWQNFEDEFGKNFQPTLNNLQSQNTKEYFKNFSKTAKNNVEVLKDFNFCFDDKFYSFKSTEFENTIQNTDEQLTYIAYLYDKLAELILQENKEIEVIQTIEEIEKIDFKKLPILSKDFDNKFIISPTKKVYIEGAVFNFEEKYLKLQIKYNELINKIVY